MADRRTTYGWGDGPLGWASVPEWPSPPANDLQPAAAARRAHARASEKPPPARQRQADPPGLATDAQPLGRAAPSSRRSSPRPYRRTSRPTPSAAQRSTSGSAFGTWACLNCQTAARRFGRCAGPPQGPAATPTADKRRRQRGLPHNHQVGGLHSSPRTMAKHQRSPRPVDSMQIDPRLSRR